MIVLFSLVLAALSASGKVIFTKIGDTVTLDCGVSDSKYLKWSHKSHESHESHLIFSISGTHSYPRKGSSHMKDRCSLRHLNLEVRGVIPADAGKFTCQTDRQTQEMTLVVFSLDVRPSPDLQVANQATLDCKVYPKTAVQWVGPDDRTRAESAKVELHPVARLDAGKWKCILSLDGHMHTEPLEVTVKEPRPTAPSPPSRIPGNVNVPSGQAEPDEPVSPPNAVLLGIPWWVWLVIGGVGLVVAVLLVILVVCMCRRVRKRRRLARKMKNGLQLRTPLQYCQCDGPTAAAKPQQRRQRAKPSAPPPQTLPVE